MKNVTIMNGQEWGVGKLDSPEVSVGGPFGAIHWYQDEELIRIVNPATGVDVVVPEELFVQFLDHLDAVDFEWIGSLREDAFAGGRDDCESEHGDED